MVQAENLMASDDRSEPSPGVNVSERILRLFWLGAFNPPGVLIRVLNCRPRLGFN